MKQPQAETLEQIDSPVKSPFIEHLGIQFFRLGAGSVELRLPVRPELLNSAAMVHGGVYATLADCALAAVIHGLVPTGHMVVTLDLGCRYLRAARAGVLRATARAVHVGRRTAVAEGEIWVDDVMQVKATGSFMIVSRAGMSAAGAMNGDPQGT
ncbi:MAG: PaaI family thioesterase [Pseudomonadales bacterium]|jgi:uncharacterized protein (TIGR00369 family)|nr:PaaI family thioesterase [Pseudomonadales bacterium]MBP9034570.1 PaaI family thioesterase [Pseudomonadales bacterium]